MTAIEMANGYTPLFLIGVSSNELRKLRFRATSEDYTDLAISANSDN